MAVKFKRGAPVEQVVRPIQGTVVAVHVVDDEVEYLVEYTGDDGELHKRSFKEDQIQARTDPL